MNKKPNLPIPSGTESLHIHEAFTHRLIEREIENIYMNWGYFPIQTPVFDFYDHYADLLNDRRKDESYRLIDREGELLLLRSDITLFLSKQLSSGVDTKDLPLRVYYGDTILRHQDKEDISHNEFFQSGCELVGAPSQDSDLEALILLREILESLSLKGYRIHIGSRRLFDILLKDLSIDQKEKAASALRERDLDEMKLILDDNFPKEESDKLLKALFFIGTLKEFSSYINDKLKSDFPHVSSDWDYYLGLIDQIIEIDMEDSFRFDFSEIGNQAYYSGIIFQAYAPGADSAIASGGRYDDLIQRDGVNISSVGFSILQRKLQSLLPAKEMPEPYRLEKMDNFSDRYKKAKSLREKGRAVII